jgi:hypothetical protein
MERRRNTVSKASPLPDDYLKLVAEVFTANFDAGLKKLTQLAGPGWRFEASGSIFSDEIVLCISLLHEEELAATSVYASSDFDPKASAPSIQDILASCVDAIGAIFGQLLGDNPERLEQVASRSLSAMDNVPFHWTEVNVERRRLHVKVDKANPKLDRMADNWLAQHDPSARARESEEQQETEKLFVTGPKPGKKSSGTTH